MIDGPDPDPDPAALAAVVAAEERFYAQQDHERLRLHRLRLQATVTAVSPLTRDLVEQQGYSLAAVAEKLRPTPSLSPGMPHLHTFRHLIPGRMGHPTSRTGAPVRQSDQRISRRIARKGVILPTAPGSRDLLGVVNDGPVLECAGWLGRYWFCTQGRIGHVLLNLPATIAAMVPGLSVGDIVEHAALSNRPYRVRRATALDDEGGVVLSFFTGLIEHAMPWESELSMEMERSA
jgi:hypothetical protein